MELLYHNEQTDNFIEFDAEEIDESLPEDEIIDIFMERVRKFDDSNGVALPEELLLMLQDKELDLFLYAAYVPEYFDAISNMLYVIRHDKYIPDQHGTLFKVDYIGKKLAVLSYEQIDALNMFSVPAEHLKQGFFNTKNITQKEY